MTARRIQRSREKGARLPAGTVVVTRGTRWGNPFIAFTCLVDNKQLARWGWTFVEAAMVNGETKADALASFERMLLNDPDGVLAVRRDLAGKDLACWCKPGSECHADVLLRVANDAASAPAEPGDAGGATPSPVATDGVAR